MTSTLLILAQVVSVAPAGPPPTLYTVTLWGMEEGLPQSSVTDIAMAPDGYMWMTTYGGPVRFDGHRFEARGAGLPNRQTTAISPSAFGGMLVGLIGGGVWRIGRDTVERLDAEGVLPVAIVSELAEAADGGVWVGMSGRVVLLGGGGDERAVSTWTEVDGRPIGFGRTMAAARDGGVWVGAGATACLIDSDRGECLAEAQHPEGVAVSGLLHARDGALWIAWIDGRIVRADPSGSAHEVPCPRTSACGPRPAAALAEDEHGRIWIAGPGEVTVLAPDGATEFVLADGVPMAEARDVHPDGEGGMWVGYEAAGAIQIRPARVRRHGESWQVGSVVRHPSGGVAAAVPCGILRVAPDDLETCDDVLDGESIRALHPTGDGGLWIGSTLEGLATWYPGSEPRRVVLDEPDVRALEVDGRGILWVGQFRGIDRVHPSGVVEHLAGPGDVRFAAISAFAEDADGRMWIGSNGGGLSVFEGDSLRHVGRSTGLGSVQVAALLVDRTRSLWVGTSDAGLWRRGGDGWIHFDTVAGLPDRTITQLLEDETGDLWIGTNRGIARLPRDDIEAFSRGEAASVGVSVIQQADGMRNAETSGGGFHPAGLATDDGRLWFSTVQGLVSTDPATYPLNRTPPVTKITGIRIEQGPIRDIEGRGTVEVSPGSRSFELQYTAIGFSHPGRMRFRYRLAGFEEEWVDARTRRVAYYTRMRPGRYTFDVLASNSDGVWTQTPATVDVAVLPRFWEAGPFRLLLFATLVMASIGAGRLWEDRRTRRRLERLERERALQGERSRIARDLHDDLGARLTRIALLADLQQAGAEPAVAVGDVARDASVAMDELVWAIDARNDNLRDLAGYAANFAEDHLRPAGVTCSIRVPPHLPRWPLAAATRRNLFLVFKEAVHNVVKHADADRVEISFEAEDGWFRFSVTDDGRGFDVTAARRSGSDGLRNMRERVESSAGRIHVESEPGSGTRIIVDLPAEPIG